MEAPLPDAKSLKEHYAWRKRVNKSLPKLADRVFTLRSRFYSGCGFHYGMEKNLGRAIAQNNDYDSHLTWDRMILEKVILEQLYQSVKEAEKSADELKGKYEDEKSE